MPNVKVEVEFDIDFWIENKQFCVEIYDTQDTRLKSEPVSLKHTIDIAIESGISDEDLNEIKKILLDAVKSIEKSYD